MSQGRSGRYVRHMTRLCEGRICIVTGGARGIGRQHALMLAEHGAKVVVNDLGGERDGSGGDPGPANEAVVVITAPVVDLFHGIATREDRAGRSDLVANCLPIPDASESSAFGPGSAANPNHSWRRMKSPPGFSGLSLGPAMYPSSDIDM